MKSKRERRQRRCQKQTMFRQILIRKAKLTWVFGSYGLKSVNEALLRFRHSVFVSPKKMMPKRNPDSLFAVKLLWLVNTKLRVGQGLDIFFLGDLLMGLKICGCFNIQNTVSVYNIIISLSLWRQIQWYNYALKLMHSLWKHWVSSDLILRICCMIHHSLLRSEKVKWSSLIYLFMFR